MCVELENQTYPKRLLFDYRYSRDKGRTSYAIGVKELHSGVWGPADFRGTVFRWNGSLAWDCSELTVWPTLTLQTVSSYFSSRAFKAQLGMHLYIPDSLSYPTSSSYLCLFCYFPTHHIQIAGSNHAVVEQAHFPIFKPSDKVWRPKSVELADINIPSDKVWHPKIAKLAAINRGELRKLDQLSVWENTNSFKLETGGYSHVV